MTLEITHEGHTALNERKARIKNLQAVEKNTSNGNFEGLRSSLKIPHFTEPNFCSARALLEDWFGWG